MPTKSIAYLCAAVASLLAMPSVLPAAETQIQFTESHGGVPVRNAILTRRYGPAETEDEVSAKEIEAGYGATPTFQLVRYRSYYRPYRYYAGYGPRVYAGYGPRVYTSYYGPAWGGYYGAPYGAFYPPTYYAPRPYFYGYYGGYYPPGWGGGYYW